MAAPSAMFLSRSVKTSHISYPFVRKICVSNFTKDAKQLSASGSCFIQCRFHCQTIRNCSQSRSQKLKFVCDRHCKRQKLFSGHAKVPHSYFYTGSRMSPLNLSHQDESHKSSQVYKKRNEDDIDIEETDFSDTAQLLNNHKVTFSEQTSSSSEQQEDVVIVGNARQAGHTYRKRVERKALRDDADTSSAATMAARIRKELKDSEKEKRRQTDGNEDVDKKKSKSLRHQIQDISKLQESTVAEILRKSVIYNQGDIVAIDKPYGIPSHGGPRVTHNIDSLLPLLARNLAKKGDEDPTLHLVHRLDKETTGVMVLAKTEHMLRRLQAMFRHRKVIKKYWVITVGIPDPPSGVIDMPLVEAEIGDRYRMVVKPDLSSVYPGMKRRKTPATDAITKFKVLDAAKKCALVELEAMTGVKHQIRVHLAQGMACPILGDHKYSHFNKQAPQRLPYSMLLCFGITQPKVRTIPMHLHAQSLILSEFFVDGRNLNISTKLPKFFATNLRKLKLKVSR
ncbi:pseudouridylate synthase RPUSD4, mitochondrial-like [Amphiura filiformis]|uniref:pseudouridylate synthase RPUSD4, mitochondrial-like n=1 Tax=Amphiura filiformis TaxID=82378 RepID=UPI003B226B0C